MRIHRKTYLDVGVACILLVLGRAERGGDQTTTATVQAVAIHLGGERGPEFSQGPVYRRFDRLTIGLEGVSEGELRRLQVILEPMWPERPSSDGPGHGKVPVPMQPVSLHRAQGELRLESDDGPMAVGPYRVAVYRTQEGLLQRIAEQPLFVIFNAFDPADQAVYHGEAGDYFSDQMRIVQKSMDGEPRMYDWHLDTRKDQVFRLAIEAVAGSRHPRTAVQRVAWATASTIEGFWPGLGIGNDRPSGETRNKNGSWKPASIRSIAQRLQTRARRGQCFDYAALSVALLRSVGVVATAASVMDPEDMDHPRATDQQVSWSFHVWTEVHIDGHWRAMDIAYLDGIFSQGTGWDVSPGLQSYNGPWFMQMIGPDSRVFRQRGRQVVDVTMYYQRPGKRASPPANDRKNPPASPTRNARGTS